MYIIFIYFIYTNICVYIVSYVVSKLVSCEKMLDLHECVLFQTTMSRNGASAGEGFSIRRSFMRRKIWSPTDGPEGRSTLKTHKRPVKRGVFSKGEDRRPTVIFQWRALHFKEGSC